MLRKIKIKPSYHFAKLAHSSRFIGEVAKLQTQIKDVGQALFYQKIAIKYRLRNKKIATRLVFLHLPQPSILQQIKNITYTQTFIYHTYIHRHSIIPLKLFQKQLQMSLPTSWPKVWQESLFPLLYTKPQTIQALSPSIFEQKPAQEISSLLFLKRVSSLFRGQSSPLFLNTLVEQVLQKNNPQPANTATYSLATKTWDRSLKNDSIFVEKFVIKSSGRYVISPLVLTLAKTKKQQVDQQAIVELLENRLTPPISQSPNTVTKLLKKQQSKTYGQFLHTFWTKQSLQASVWQELQTSVLGPSYFPLSRWFSRSMSNSTTFKHPGLGWNLQTFNPLQLYIFKNFIPQVSQKSTPNSRHVFMHSQHDKTLVKTKPLFRFSSLHFPNLFERLPILEKHPPNRQENGKVNSNLRSINPVSTHIHHSVGAVYLKAVHESIASKALVSSSDMLANLYLSRVHQLKLMRNQSLQLQGNQKVQRPPLMARSAVSTNNFTLTHTKTPKPKVVHHPTVPSIVLKKQGLPSEKVVNGEKVRQDTSAVNAPPTAPLKTHPLTIRETRLVANQVYDIINKKIKQEKRRRGL